MSYSDKQMLRDVNGDLIPQYWDIQDEEFKPLTGQNGAQDTRLTGSKVDRVETVFKREVSNKSSSFLKIYPPNIFVKGVLIHIFVHGITGDDVSIRFERMASVDSIVNADSRYIYEEILETDSSGYFIIGFGVSELTEDLFASKKVDKVINLKSPFFGVDTRISSRISGEMDDKEGVDYEVIAEWAY